MSISIIARVSISRSSPSETLPPKICWSREQFIDVQGENWNFLHLGLAVPICLAQNQSLSAPWLEGIPSQARHSMLPAVFSCVLQVCWGLSLPKRASPATRRCHDYLMFVDTRRLTVGLRWLSTRTSSRAALFSETSHCGPPCHPQRPIWGGLHLDF